MNKAISVAIVALVAATSFAIGNQQTTNRESASTSTNASAEAENLTSDMSNVPSQASDALMKALMDPNGEYAAYAMYTAVIDKYGQVEPYVTIREAELRHINALTRQLNQLGVDVPANPYLDSAVAPDNLSQAAKAWALGEQDNVLLYDELMKATTDSQAQRVFTNLRRASLEVHLPMFELAAENGGVLSADQMQH